MLNQASHSPDYSRLHGGTTADNVRKKTPFLAAVARGHDRKAEKETQKPRAARKKEKNARNTQSTSPPCRALLRPPTGPSIFKAHTAPRLLCGPCTKMKFPSTPHYASATTQEKTSKMGRRRKERRNETRRHPDWDVLPKKRAQPNNGRNIANQKRYTKIEEKAHAGPKPYMVRAKRVPETKPGKESFSLPAFFFVFCLAFCSRGRKRTLTWTDIVIAGNGRIETGEEAKSSHREKTKARKIQVAKGSGSFFNASNLVPRKTRPASK